MLDSLTDITSVASTSTSPGHVTKHRRRVKPAQAFMQSDALRLSADFDPQRSVHKSSSTVSSRDHWTPSLKVTSGTSSGMPAGWNTQSVAGSHEVAHFGSSTMQPSQQNKSGSAVSSRTTGISDMRMASTRSVSDSDMRNGSTRVVKPDHVNSITRNRKLTSAASSSAIGKSKAHVTKKKQTNTTQSEGDVEISLPLKAAQALGLASASEQQATVTVSMPRLRAEQLGLAPAENNQPVHGSTGTSSAWATASTGTNAEQKAASALST